MHTFFQCVRLLFHCSSVLAFRMFFFLVTVEIWHHCKGEWQKKTVKTDSCEKVTSVSVQNMFDLALFSSGFHSWWDKHRTPLGAHAGFHAKFLLRLELGKKWCVSQPFPISRRDNNSCFGIQRPFRWSWNQVKPVCFQGTLSGTMQMAELRS